MSLFGQFKSNRDGRPDAPAFLIAAGDPAPVTEIADVAKAMGYKKVVKVSADDLAELEKVLKDAMDGDEGAVIIAYAPCRA